MWAISSPYDTDKAPLSRQAAGVGAVGGSKWTGLAHWARSHQDGRPFAAAAVATRAGATRAADCVDVSHLQSAEARAALGANIKSRDPSTDSSDIVLLKAVAVGATAGARCR